MSVIATKVQIPTKQEYMHNFELYAWLYILFKRHMYMLFFFMSVLCVPLYTCKNLYIPSFFFWVVSEIILLDTHFFSFFRLFS